MRWLDYSVGYSSQMSLELNLDIGIDHTGQFVFFAYIMVEKQQNGVTFHILVTQPDISQQSHMTSENIMENDGIKCLESMMIVMNHHFFYVKSWFKEERLNVVKPNISKSQVVSECNNKLHILNFTREFNIFFFPSCFLTPSKKKSFCYNDFET